MNISLGILSILLFIVCSENTFAYEKIVGPWTTGPLVSPNGKTIPKGYTNVQPYYSISQSNTIYNDHWRRVPAPFSETSCPNIELIQGLAKRLDIETDIPYEFNKSMGQAGKGWDDITMKLGYQLIDSIKNSAIPNLRVWLQEKFPSGRYQHLSPYKEGTDATGDGTYQTSIGGTFQQTYRMSDGRYLIAYLSLVYRLPAKTKVVGFNTYGGGFGTNGTVEPGNKVFIDLAFEYTLTQNWVSAIDIIFNSQDKTTFQGIPGLNADKTIATVGDGKERLLSLVPAIEYNFNSHWGIIAGTWFVYAGRNQDDFAAFSVSINYYGRSPLIDDSL